MNPYNFNYIYTCTSRGYFLASVESLNVVMLWRTNRRQRTKVIANNYLHWYHLPNRIRLLSVKLFVSSVQSIARFSKWFTLVTLGARTCWTNSSVCTQFVRYGDSWTSYLFVALICYCSNSPRCATVFSKIQLLSSAGTTEIYTICLSNSLI